MSGNTKAIPALSILPLEEKARGIPSFPLLVLRLTTFLGSYICQSLLDSKWADKMVNFIMYVEPIVL